MQDNAIDYRLSDGTVLVGVTIPKTRIDEDGDVDSILASGTSECAE